MGGWMSRVQKPAQTGVYAGFSERLTGTAANALLYGQ